MRGRSPLQSLAASPTMVGAVTTLIVIVAVFLAYNANNGLPFVPVYRVSIDVPNAARLVQNNEVRIGGTRVGVVESIEPVQTDVDPQTGQPVSQTGAKDTCCVAARLNLKLDQSAAPLPEDSIFRVRYRSSFGLKYLEIVRGTGQSAPEGYVFNGTDDDGECELPLHPHTFSKTEAKSAKDGCFQPQTEFDAINDTFDTQTRTNSRANLVGFGDAFAGRGASLNEAFSQLKPLFQNLKPVAHELAAPRTGLARFIRALAHTAEIVAPVAEQQADMFTQGATTFAAISSDPDALRATISEGPPTLEAGIETFPRQRTFLTHFITLTEALRPGVHDLRATLPVLNDAIETGTPVLRRSVGMSQELKGVFEELRQLVEQPSTRITLQRLRETFDEAKPLARHVVPAQTVCNYIDYWGAGLANAFSDRDQVGFSFRQTITGFPSGESRFDVKPGPGEVTFYAPGDVATGVQDYSGYQANGREFDKKHYVAGPLPGSGPQPKFDEKGRKFKPYEDPILNAAGIYGPSGQDGSDCSGGQNGYDLGQLRVPGQAPSNPAVAASDLPGSRGPAVLYWNQNSTRAIRDTRVASRQPGTWKGVGP